MTETKMMDVDSSNYCSICLNEVTTQASTTLECNHTFHTHCYTTFLAHNIIHKKEDIQCPLCRESILQIIVQSPTNIHLITNVSGEDSPNRPNSQGNEDTHTLLMEQAHNSNEDNDATQACTMAVVSMVKIGIISLVMYISFLFIQCGMGTNNVMCNDAQ